MQWYIFDEQESTVKTSTNLESALDYARTVSNTKYATKIGTHYYACKGNTKTTFVAGADVIEQHGLTHLKTNKVSHSNITKHQIIEECDRIRFEKGPGYFISPGSITSQNYTGTSDYWKILYEIRYEGFAGGLNIKYASKRSELEKVIKSIDANRIVIITVNVQRFLQGHKADEIVFLGSVRCDKYDKYRHKLGDDY